MTNQTASHPIDATFGFIDLAGFSALTEAHGDAEAVALLDRFEAITTDALGPDDRLVKTIGDAVMLAFPGPDAAIAATTRLFTALAATDLPVARAGLHHGSAIEHNDDYLGASVNEAASPRGRRSKRGLIAAGLIADTAAVAVLVSSGDDATVATDHPPASASSTLATPAAWDLLGGFSPGRWDRGVAR